jgi:tetratricopeptide (TPR) repeat protein
LFLPQNLCHAWDWKALHIRADKITLEEALKIAKESPESPADSYLLALVYLNLHRDSQAKELFIKILGADKNAPQAEWGIAEVMRREHKLKESENILEKIILMRPIPPFLTLNKLFIGKKGRD